MDDNRQAMALSAGIASVAVALVLVGLKLWGLGVTGALSIAASLTDSALDLLVSLGSLAAIRYAARPPDSEHAFGHTSAEDLAALGQAVLVSISAGVIALGAVGRLIATDPPPLMDEAQGIAVMVASTAITAGLVWWQRRVARRTGSKVVAADSVHYLADIVPSIGAIIALLASSVFGLGQIDSIIALAGAVMLLVAGARIGKTAWDALMDRAADVETIGRIERVLTAWPGLHGYHDLKTRTAGAKVFVQVHIELDGAQSLSDAHAIGASLRRAIMVAVPQAEVIVHKDPVRDPRPPGPGPAGG